MSAHVHKYGGTCVCKQCIRVAGHIYASISGVITVVKEAACVDFMSILLAVGLIKDDWKIFGRSLECNGF